MYNTLKSAYIYFKPGALAAASMHLVSKIDPVVDCQCACLCVSAPEVIITQLVKQVLQLLYGNSSHYR